MKRLNNLFLASLFFKVFFLLNLVGCATKKDRDFLDFDAKEVESSLGIDKKTLAKFKVQKTSARPLKRRVKKTKTKTKVKLDPKKSKPLLLEKKKAVKKNIKINKKKIFSYPEDYPKAFKKYDERSKVVWPKFSPLIFPEEKFTFRVGYLGITAGFIKMETLPTVSIGGVKAYHFKARMRSARYYSYIYTLDDSLESFVSTEEFIPLKYVLLQRESAQTVDDLQLFDSQKLKTYHFYKRLKKGKKKNVELNKPIPRYFQDSYSALFFVRGLPLKEGDQYEFPIVTRGKIWILKIKIEGIDSLKIMDKWVSAIRINAETRFPGVLEKKGDIRFWYSNDEFRKLLKFQADVKIGSITGELVDYKSGK